MARRAANQRALNPAVAEPVAAQASVADSVDQASLIRDELARQIGDGAMAVWFGEGIEFVEYPRQKQLTVVVPTNFFRERILSRFEKPLRQALVAVKGQGESWSVAVLLPDEARRQAEHEAAAIAPPPAGPVIGKEPEFSLVSPKLPERKSKSSPPADPAADWPTTRPETRAGSVPGLFGPAPVKAVRRLDNFVVGPCNRMAHTAALEMVKSRGAAFNPLILHGGVGLGKTHLLDGIAHAIRGKPGAGRVIHTSAEAFTNAFLEALRTGQLSSFRGRFRNASALIMDDVHFIASKRATQNEFLHTFNSLIAEDVPIVLSCDQHPKRVNRLMEELSTRFMAGMVVRLETPDPELRRLILRTKAAARGIELPDGVIDLLGEQLRVSVRELEGALNSLIAHSVLTGRRIDMELAREVLRDSIRHTVQSVSINDVDSAICNVFALTRDILHSRKTSQAITIPRTLAMYLARRHTPASYTEIARHYGLKNHSSVIAAEKRVKQWLDEPAKSPAVGGYETAADMIAALQVALGV